jgi:hypothetical protein
MLGMCGLYSIPTCAPRGRYSVRVTLCQEGRVCVSCEVGCSSVEVSAWASLVGAGGGAGGVDVNSCSTTTIIPAISHHACHGAACLGNGMLRRVCPSLSKTYKVRQFFCHVTPRASSRNEPRSVTWHHSGIEGPYLILWYTRKRTKRDTHTHRERQQNIFEVSQE